MLHKLCGEMELKEMFILAEKKKTNDLNTHRFPHLLTSQMLVLASTRPGHSQELGCPGHLCGWQEPDDLRHHHCLPGAALAGRETWS